jgi:hypothetical protein
MTRPQCQPIKFLFFALTFLVSVTTSVLVSAQKTPEGPAWNALIDATKSVKGPITAPSNAAAREKLRRVIARFPGTMEAGLAQDLLDGSATVVDEEEEQAVAAPAMTPQMKRDALRAAGAFVPSGAFEPAKACPALPRSRVANTSAHSVNEASYARWGLTEEDFMLRSTWSAATDGRHTSTTLLKRSGRQHCREAILAWAQTGDLPAMFLAWQILINPMPNQPQDIPGAERWLKAASESGFAPAILAQARQLVASRSMFDPNRPTSPLATRAREYLVLLERAARAGSKEAQSQLAIYSYSGLVATDEQRSETIVQRRPSQATFAQIEAFANQGEAEAIAFLIRRYALGDSQTPRNDQRASEWSDRLLSAGGGLCLTSPRTEEETERRSRLCPPPL